MILPIYEIIVVKNRTDSLTSTAPGSQNTHGEKIAFYALRDLPEVIVAGLLLSLDLRNIFGTGMTGDKFSNPKPKPQTIE